jgi:pimeloyl-ACP methyl ester carboxylesterase/ketosteroid isomerase-like protein
MQRLLVVLVLLLLPMTSLADAVDEVRQAELAFARAFAERDKAAFFAFVADDATFLSAGGAFRGKQQVVAGWSGFFDGPVAPFSWAPDRVSVSADGAIGLSTGPVLDPAGRHAGDFISTWRKSQDGRWQVVFDSSGPGPAPLAEHVAPVEEGRVKAPDGAELYYRKVGRGRMTVIAPLDFLLHDELKQLANLATVITYDLRNRGRSSRETDPARLSIAQDVTDLETVRAHFKVEKFVPIGYSYLGKAVAMYAAKYPQHVARMVQLAPAANVDEVTGTSRAVEDFGAPREALVRWEAMRSDESMTAKPREACLVQWEVFRYYMVGNPNSAARFPVEATCALENEWPVNFQQHMKSHGETIRKALLTPAEVAKVSMPVLILHGTKDRNAPYAAGEQWLTLLPDARLVTIPGAAHALWLDDPLTVFAALRTFLRGEWPASATAKVTGVH